MDERTITTEWTNVAPMTTGREFAASVALDEHRFLVLGGIDTNRETLSSIELFDRQKRKGKWKRLSCDIPKRLHSAAAARVGDTVYLIGGSSHWGNSSSTSNKIFALDISTSSSSEWTWERLPSMMEKRSGCATVANGKFIYVIGGRDEDNYVLDSVERYNSDTEKWKTIESMPTKRNGCAAVPVGNKIYVIGGCQYSATVEVFDLQNQTWESTSTVNEMFRRAPAAVAIGRYIVVTGGLDRDGNPFSSVEVLDTSSGNWTSINSMIKEYWGAGHTAVVLNESDVYVTNLGRIHNGEFAFCNKISLPALNAITSNHRHKKTPAKKVTKQERIFPNAITSNHRHKKTPSKKVTKQKNVLPIDTEIFISACFRGDSSEAEARSLHRELLNLGMKAFMVDAKAGDNFGTHTKVALFRMKTMVAFCSSEYGAKTSNPYCTYFELENAHEEEKHIVAIRRCKDWPPKPSDHDGGVLGMANNDIVLTQGIAYLPWHNKDWDAVECAREVKYAFETRHPSSHIPVISDSYDNSEYNDHNQYDDDDDNYDDNQYDDDDSSENNNTSYENDDDINNIGPKDTEIFISARFCGDKYEDEARSLHRELLKLKMKAFMIDAHPGDNFDEMTSLALLQMKTMVAFVSSEYGARTTNKWCTYYELKRAYGEDKHIVAIRRCKDWPPIPPLDHDGEMLGKALNRMVFHQGLHYLSWHFKNKKWDAVKCAKEVKAAFDKRHPR